MFKQIGKTLKVVGELLFFLEIVAGFILACCAVSWEEGLYWILAGSMFVGAFLTGVPIVGLGRLVENSNVICEKLTKLNSDISTAEPPPVYGDLPEL